MLEFFDTETINNKTVLICNSKNFLWNNDGLDMFELLEFLLNNSNKYNYFFRIDYDLNMILKDLEKIKLIKLFKGEKIFIKNNKKIYTLQYYRNKIFILNNRKFFDIFNFFQTSLVKVIDILEINLNSQEKLFIKEMKGKRSEFKLKDKEKIIKYSILENQIGLKIVNKIYDLIPANLKTYSLYGASALANKFLKQSNYEKNDLFNLSIFENSYFGGRMEVFKIGTFNNVYKYDLNSAYPSIIKDLRIPLYFDLKKYNNEKIIETNIYEIEFNHKTINEIGCFPTRLKSGYLIFSKEGSGWFYGCELIQALNRNVEIKINNFIDVKVGNKIFNNKEIENIYSLRKKFKENNDLKHYIYKRLLTSLYGKFAQKVGKKQFTNFYLSGFITAKTRAKLLEITNGYDKDVIFFATDGVLIKRKLNLKINNEIGNFEEIKIKNARVILSGIYKLIDYNNKIYLGERGFRFDFEEAWKTILENKIYTVKLNSFISNIYAYKNYKKLLKYRCKFHLIEKKIDVKKQIKRKFTSFNMNTENNSYLLDKVDINKLNKIQNIKEIILEMNELEINNNSINF